MKKTFLKRFWDLTEDDLLSDMHLHTSWTDGESGINDMIAAAVEKGLKRIAFTDHVREESSYCQSFESEVIELSNKSGIHAHAGFEAKIKDFDGALDLPAYCSRERHLIIGSVHSIPVDGKGFVHPKNFKSHVELEKSEYNLTMALIESGQADILGHVGGMSKTFSEGFDLKLMEEIISSCAKTEAAFEINARYHSDIMAELLPLLKKHNPFVSIGSDAHNVVGIGKCTELLTPF